jgi:hypothetical protein
MPKREPQLRHFHSDSGRWPEAYHSMSGCKQYGHLSTGDLPLNMAHPAFLQVAIMNLRDVEPLVVGAPR